MHSEYSGRSLQFRTGCIGSCEVKRAMNWVQRKIYLYNVTFGLYMLDWWERYLFRNYPLFTNVRANILYSYDTFGLHSNMVSGASGSTAETVTGSL
ncbi:hypothetical protein Patl1_14280 [Pistacia atlantica]|uniref:Uncharacterized protein n=1 Tax=Pistacia atlantica TaxID=434234 RepID=A0ACC1ASG9_9ROSI|nr:hypothetical protein Patl1_14280 [Pistacia atlantica]